MSSEKSMTMIRDTWDLFQRWFYPAEHEEESLRWDVFMNLSKLYEKMVSEKYITLNTLLKEWDSKLSNLGGDPTHTDWSQFGPLRLSREEDWSDWLAHLLTSSQTGSFAHSLLRVPGLTRADYVLPVKVEREVSYKGYRADLIVQWKNNSYTHIEVKIGDPHLRKTPETGRLMREKYGCREELWSNFILLPTEQVADWEALCFEKNEFSKIGVITWDDAAIAIRQSLNRNELITWEVWALTFTGAIEQHLVQFPGHRISKKTIIKIDEKIHILSRGLSHE